MSEYRQRLLGKGHNLIIDHKDLVDSKEASELNPGDRIMEEVKGQTQTIAIENFVSLNAVPAKEDWTKASPLRYSGCVPYPRSFHE